MDNCFTFLAPRGGAPPVRPGLILAYGQGGRSADLTATLIDQCTGEPLATPGAPVPLDGFWGMRFVDVPMTGGQSYSLQISSRATGKVLGRVENLLAFLPPAGPITIDFPTDAPVGPTFLAYGTTLFDDLTATLDNGGGDGVLLWGPDPILGYGFQFTDVPDGTYELSVCSGDVCAEQEVTVSSAVAVCPVEGASVEEV